MLDSDFSGLEESLGISFRDKQLLQQVFIHRSYMNEHRGTALDHNERLEFLGDAVLELVVTEYLYANFPNPEGELTNFRSALVKGETLADIARELQFPQYLQVSHGERKSGGVTKGVLLANALEALIGALYLDAGYEACKKLIVQVVISRLPAILEQQLFIDPKSRLQEFTQEHYGITPTYTVIEETGPDHSKVFRVSVLVEQRELAQGEGSSKQAAQVAAATQALQAITASAAE
jgi:ribonuclease III